jgi:hypothetical protein
LQSECLYGRSILKKPTVKDKKPYKNISWYVEKRKTSEERRHEGENNCPVIDKPGV